MELDKEQVELINSFLVKNEVVFDDMRFEIIDHIASDVEENYSEIPFHDAIKIVLKKWETQIQLSDSLWVSSRARFPKIILGKLKQLFIPQLITFAVIMIVGGIVDHNFSEVIDFYSQNTNAFRIVYGIWFFIATAFGLILFFSKGFTTYKYVFKRAFYFVFLWTVVFFLTSRPTVLSLTFLIANLISSVFLYQNYKAHFKFIKSI
ncbi:hypothetical protein [Flavobacterium tegetincola]|uniref:hypothetical protein n=1 Tax=Flavobacterium tegetincola TaxID=150172 RepID=UPI00041E8D7D|nr:hypothetical protein [Flavobacterium tegetincola]